MFAGGHTLSGAVIQPNALEELFPDWKERGVCFMYIVEISESWYKDEIALRGPLVFQDLSFLILKSLSCMVAVRSFWVTYGWIKGHSKRFFIQVIWGKVFKNGPKKNLWKIAFRCLNKPYPSKCFKGCLPQILLDPFVNTLPHLLL